MPSATAHHRPSTSAVTSGVKYRPSAAPMVHWPALRSAFRLSVGSPSKDAQAVASSGPIIHGMGVPSLTHSWAAPQASASVPRARTARRATESGAGAGATGAAWESGGADMGA